MPLELEGPPSLRGTFPANLGFLLAFGALVAIAGNLFLPWYAISFTMGAQTHLEVFDRAYVVGSGGYLVHLGTWSLVAWVAVLLAGLVAYFTERRDVSQPRRDLLMGGVLFIVAFSGFILALTGTRWLGIQIVELMNTDPSRTFFLHAAAYLNLLGGVALIAGGSVFLARLLREYMDLGVLVADPRLRAPALVAVVAAGGLLLMPLLPFIVVNGVYMGERAMAFQWVPLGVMEPAQTLGSSRVMVWAVLVLALVSLVAGLLDRRLRAGRIITSFRHAVLLSVIPIVLLGVYTVSFYTGIEGGSYFFNPFYPLTGILLAGGYVHYVVTMLVPAVRKNVDTSSA